MSTPDRWIGRTIGRFHIIDRLAVGGMSVVYRAYDPERREDVALKMLLDTYLDHETVSARFAQEVELVQTLRHRHLVDVYETGSVDGRRYMVLQLIDGGNFSHILEAQPTITIGHAVHLITQIAQVLDYIHGEGVIHRDIKLGNILIDKAMNAYLIDFGIAHWSQMAGTDDAAALMPGTARYMPPEQIITGLPFDHRADIYALGVVAYLLTTGYFPFTGSTDRELLSRHLTTTPQAPSAVHPPLPLSLDAVLQRALAKRVSERFATAGGFAAAFAHSVAHCHDTTVTLRLTADNPGHLLPDYAHLQAASPPAPPQPQIDSSLDAASLFLSDAEAEIFRLYAQSHP